jgi:hypothetical protein
MLVYYPLKIVPLCRLTLHGLCMKFLIVSAIFLGHIIIICITYSVDISQLKLPVM